MTSQLSSNKVLSQPPSDKLAAQSSEQLAEQASELINHFDSILPQTQCGDCTYAGCKPYAEAIVNQHESIGRCLPGGVKVLQQIAALLERDPTPYLDSMEQKCKPPATAIIRESECIGCTKCIQACPVDAIIGAGKQMHTVIQGECTGCGLCVEPCPVDCIDIKILDEPNYNPVRARARYEQKQRRIQAKKDTKKQSYQQAKTLAEDQSADRDAKKAYIQAALARVKAKRKIK